MNVELLECTTNPEKLSALSVWNCHREDIPSMDEMDEETTKEILEKTIESGHVGVVEHVNLTFGIEGVSRVLSHQFVRHRIASYDQQSQRVVDGESFDYVKPSTIEEDGMIEPEISDTV